ncbi:hypothetical protein PMIN06_010642 [Paraphaeosphaeria minitans]
MVPRRAKGRPPPAPEILPQDKAACITGRLCPKRCELQTLHASRPCQITWPPLEGLVTFSVARPPACLPACLPARPPRWTTFPGWPSKPVLFPICCEPVIERERARESSVRALLPSPPSTWTWTFGHADECALSEPVLYILTILSAFLGPYLVVFFPSYAL